MASTSDEERTAANGGVSRRGFLRGVGAATVLGEGLIGLANKTAHAAPADVPADGAAQPAAADGRVVRGEVPITLTINGQSRQVNVEPRTTLLSALRDRLEPAITGPKLVCDAGTCGACTVLLDGKPAYGCSILAIDAVGRQVTTVEGLGTPDKLHPVQQAFCEKDAMMCGFCTSGFVTNLAGFLAKHPDANAEQVREGCKGNFCRCGTFPHIFEAAQSAATAMKKA